MVQGVVDTNGGITPMVEYRDIMKLIDWMPTEDAQPVKQGHWIRKRIYYVCSECGIELIDDNFEQIAIFPRGYMLFCPNCSAKMNGVDAK